MKTRKFIKNIEDLDFIIGCLDKQISNATHDKEKFINLHVFDVDNICAYLKQLRTIYENSEVNITCPTDLVIEKET